MHLNETAVGRLSVVVERDWLRDEWVLTRALSAADGSVIASTRSTYPTSMFSADDVLELVDAAITEPATP